MEKDVFELPWGAYRWYVRFNSVSEVTIFAFSVSSRECVGFWTSNDKLDFVESRLAPYLMPQFKGLRVRILFFVPSHLKSEDIFTEYFTRELVPYDIFEFVDNGLFYPIGEPDYDN